MTAPGWWTRVRSAPGRLNSRWRGGPVILMYHRIAPPASDPWSLAVSPTHFAEHLEVLRERLRPTPLRDLAGALRAGEVPRRAVAVTFDDGYADNLHAARPLLARYDVPATVFVVAGMTGRPHGFWWDRLAAFFLHDRPLPRMVEVEVEVAGERLALETDGDLPSGAAPARWVVSAPPPTRRHASFLRFWRRLREVEEDEREVALERLARALGEPPADDPDARALSPDELVRLADGGLVEIGAHTVTHSRLSALSPALQEREVRESRTRLEARVGRPVVSFSYPFGGPAEHTPTTVRLVRAAGFRQACTTSAAAVSRRADPLRLPRIHVPDCDGDAFARLLSRWTSLDGRRLTAGAGPSAREAR